MVEGDEMFRRMITAAVAVSAVAALAACTSDGGDKPQSSSPADATPPVSTSAPTSSTPSTPASTTAPTPTGFGAAQPAVDTYLQLVNASNAAFRAPQSVSAALINKLTAGQAKISFDQSLASAKKQGIAYKGTPSTPRLKVVTSDLSGTLPAVVLRDCGLESKSDPFVGYYVATGKAVATATPSVPPPYAKTIKLFQPNKKSWVVTSLVTDGSKTCKP